MELPLQDRVGLSWRAELAAGIFAHQEQIDVVEVIADDWFDASRSKVSALRTLAMQIPLQLHGTSAGLASATPLEEKRLAKMARLVEMVQPEGWSEHLAFVRGGGWEIGHLAAVPRNSSTVEHCAANVARAPANRGCNSNAGKHRHSDRSASEFIHRDRVAEPGYECGGCASAP